MLKNKHNLIIIGPMGAGKTRVGFCLAKKLRLPFYDTDQVIEAQTGVDIPFIFDKEGEAGFRRREKKIVEELTGKNGIVLSTGGGTILDEANRQYLQASGVIIYLSVSVPSQLARTVRNKRKPLLLEKDRQKILTELSIIRTPIYEQMAEWTYDTDIIDIRDLVKQIINNLGLKSNGE